MVRTKDNRRQDPGYFISSNKKTDTNRHHRHRSPDQRYHRQLHPACYARNRNLLKGRKRPPRIRPSNGTGTPAPVRLFDDEIILHQPDAGFAIAIGVAAGRSHLVYGYDDNVEAPMEWRAAWLVSTNDGASAVES